MADNRLFLALHAPYSMLGDRIHSSGVVQFDITDPTNLVEVGFFHAPEMSSTKIQVYHADAEEVNEVLVAGKYTKHAVLAFSGLLEGGTLYLLGVGLGESNVLETGLTVLDASQPMELVQVNYVPFKDRAYLEKGYLAIEGNALVMAGIDTLWLFDISHREEPKLTAVYQTGNSSYIGDMGFDNDQLYLVREDGLQFYRLDGFQLTERVFVPLPSE